MRKFIGLFLLLALIITTNVEATGVQDGGLVIDAQQVTSTGGTKVLTLADGQIIEVTGALSHTIQLIDAVDASQGWITYIANNSLGNVTVRDDFGNTLGTLATGEVGYFHLLDATTPTGRWAASKSSISNGGAGFLSPLTTKGDIHVYGVADDRFPVCADGEWMVADSAEALGWSCQSVGGGISAIGTIDSETKSANGAVIDVADLVLQTADATFPGLVSAVAQSFAGLKTFTSNLISAVISGSASSGGDLTLQSTTNATKGNIFFGDSTFDELNNRWCVGGFSCDYKATFKNVADSLADSVAFEGAGSNANRTWILNVSPLGNVGWYHPNQGVYGWGTSIRGQMGLARGAALLATDAAVIAQNPAGQLTWPTLWLQNLASQTGDAISHYASDATTKLASISAAGKGTFTGLKDSTLTAGVCHLDADGDLLSSLIVNADITDGTIANAKLANMADDTIKSNISGGAAAPSDNTLTAILDAIFGNTRGDILFRGASGWGVLPSDTSGYVLTTNGAATDPSWEPPSGGGGGSGESVSKSTTITAHGFVVGDLVYLNGSTWTKAIATSAAAAEAIAMVSAVADANNFTATYSGFVSGLSGLTAGNVMFLSASSAGAMTATEPSTAGQISKPIGVALSATELRLFDSSRGAVISSGGGGGAGLTLQHSYTTAGTSTFTAPTSGVIHVCAIGGGGGGGGGYQAGACGGGGGGGEGGAQACQTLNVTAGNTISVIRGAAGAASGNTTDGGNGGDTQIKDGSTILLHLRGGRGGKQGAVSAGGVGGGAGLGGAFGGTGATQSSGVPGSDGFVGQQSRALGGTGGNDTGSVLCAGGGGGGAGWAAGGQGGGFTTTGTINGIAGSLGSGGGGSGADTAAGTNGAAGGAGAAYIYY